MLFTLSCLDCMCSQSRDVNTVRRGSGLRAEPSCQPGCAGSVIAGVRVQEQLYSLSRVDIEARGDLQASLLAMCLGQP